MAFRTNESIGSITAAWRTDDANQNEKFRFCLFNAVGVFSSNVDLHGEENLKSDICTYYAIL